jgi:FkbM family methyltransferase
MREITQQNSLKKKLEIFIRSNLYLFIIFRFLAGRFFTNFAHEADFQIFSSFNKKKNLFLDIGANDGISAKTFRLYNKKSKIISIEINSFHKERLNFLKKNLFNFEFMICGASNKNYKTKLFQAFYKKFHLSSFDSLDINEIKDSLKKDLFDEKRKKEIKIYTKEVFMRKLDDFKFRPKMIKIDVQGHEKQVILGLLKTIRMYKPIILLEFNNNHKEIISILKVYGYKPYFYRSKQNKLYNLRKNKPFNFFLICEINIKEIDLI